MAIPSPAPTALEGAHAVPAGGAADNSLLLDALEDAVEMDMSEFKDFVEECSLETREIDFAQMTIQFTKANAVNTAQVAQERMEGR